MPEDDATATPVERHGLRFKTPLESTGYGFRVRSSAIDALMSQRQGLLMKALEPRMSLFRSSAVDARVSSYESPVVAALTSQMSALSRPAINSWLSNYKSPVNAALTAQASIIAKPAVDAMTKTFLAVVDQSAISNTLSAAATSVLRSAGTQQAASLITARTTAQMLAGHPDLFRNLLGSSWQRPWAEDAVATEDEEVRPVHATGDLFDEAALEEAWRDIERVLRKDKQLRHNIKEGARQLAPRSRIKRRSLERVLVILVWLCAVLGPWSDGEWTIDDATAPIGALAAELIVQLGRQEEKQKNVLQKNGPRRRRHRRRRKR